MKGSGKARASAGVSRSPRPTPTAVPPISANGTSAPNRLASASADAVIAFLGLEWDDALLQHQRTARDRGYIRTPSYAQVTEKIYTRSSGRWESYRKHMEPILPVLAPWIEKFGYEPV